MSDPLVLVSTKVPQSVAEDIDYAAGETGVSRSAYIRGLLEQGLGRPQSKSKDYDRGFNDGMRQAVHQIKDTLKEALAELWR